MTPVHESQKGMIWFKENFLSKPALIWWSLAYQGLILAGFAKQKCFKVRPVAGLYSFILLYSVVAV
jgi:hypothetical protein